MSDRAITRFDGTYAFLSNFFEDPIFLSVSEHDPFYGEWPSAEHLFQAFKCKYKIDIPRIRSTRTPAQAKRLGHRVELRPDWEDIKIAIMRNVLCWKFSADSTLAGWLLSTGRAELIEGNNWGDRFWGQVNGRGHNMLGELLMERRGVLLGKREYGSDVWKIDIQTYPI
jgi:ribA/ribD-fused uncharacterized protein